MKWSWKIGRFAGIDVFVHVTFILLIGWLAISYWIQENSLAAAAAGVGFILALFASVVLHEYGHALTARYFGVQTRDITLYPIGGVARLERIPEIPIQELWVALAGPAVNLVIAAVLFAWLWLTAALEPLASLSLTGGSFIVRLMVTNLALVAFNLIPAFPMDGGRVLRSLLALRLDYTDATQIAASIGQLLAFVFGFVGLFSNTFLVFIALFVWIGAQSEAQAVRMKSALSGVPVSRAMLTDFSLLHPDDNLAAAIHLVLAGSQKEFPVVEDGKVVGILTLTDLISALEEKEKTAPVREAMVTEFETADSYEMLDSAFIRLQTCECKTLPILRRGELVGLVTMDNIGEFIRIQATLDSQDALSKISAA